MKNSRILRNIVYIAAVGAAASLAATALMFPYWTDPAADQTIHSRDYYARAYTEAVAKNAAAPQAIQPLSEQEEIYVKRSRAAAEVYHVPSLIHDFVTKYHLEDKKVLEVGAGSGVLQDQVADYTALDISTTARRFFHKPYVEASATEMPFPDGSFDAMWTIWVLEHIPNPEQALNEIRRVTKPGGYMFLLPAWDVSRFNADGLHVRPYKDLDLKNKILKAGLPIADSKIFHYLYAHQVRALRSLSMRLGSGPSRFHFIRLDPNYDHYWENDSDATTSYSRHELYLWFNSRGDTCLNCPSEAQLTFRDDPFEFLIVQKHP